MKKLSLLGAALLSSSLLLTACSKEEPKKEDVSNSSQEKKEEKTTTQAYNFTAMDKDGKEVKLSDFKGKKVYINVWASWCGPCLREIPELEKNISANEAKMKELEKSGKNFLKNKVDKNDIAAIIAKWT